MEADSAHLAKQLDTFQEIANSWTECQNLWLSLRTELAGTDSLVDKSQSESFTKADATWRHLMSSAAANSLCSSLSANKHFVEQMNICLRQLQDIRREITTTTLNPPTDKDATASPPETE